MKRNLDLIRNMLLLIEANDKPSGMDNSAFTGLNPDSDIIDYHLYLLADSGYIDYLEVSFGCPGRVCEFFRNLQKHFYSSLADFSS